MKARTLGSGLVILGTLIAVGLVVEEGLLGQMLNEAWLDREVRDAGLRGEAVFVILTGVATAMALPRHFASFLGGYTFGFGIGTVLALAGTELGCVLTFLYARTIGRPLVGGRFGERVRRVEDFLIARPFSMTLLIRLLPVGNNFATSIAAGLSRVPAPPFLLGSLVGYVPQTMVFALAGSGVDIGAMGRIGLAVVLLIGSSLLGAWLYHHYRRGKHLSPEVDEALGEKDD